MNGALIFIKEDLRISDLQVQFLVGVFHLCALPACMVAGRTSDYIGRRYTIILTSVTFLLGSALMGYGPIYPILMIGNCISGIGAGFALMVASVYSAEISPPSYRGFLTSLPELSINLGLLIGYMSNYFLEKLSLKLGWRIMLALPAIPSLVLIIIMLKLVESPRWLIMQGRVGEARKVLLLVFNTEEKAEQRLKEIKGAVGIDENSTQDIVQVPKKARRGEGVLKELFCKPSPHVRRIVIAAIGLHVFLQLGGLGAILLYSPRIFERAGMVDKSKILLSTIGIGVCKIVFGLIAIFLVDRVGRRILLLVSAVSVALALLGLGISLTIVENSKGNEFWAIGFSIIATYIYMASMSIGVGPVTWVYSSEIFPLRLRAQGISASAWWFYYTMLPETKGRSLEEMEIVFGKDSNSDLLATASQLAPARDHTRRSPPLFHFKGIELLNVDEGGRSPRRRWWIKTEKGDTARQQPLICTSHFFHSPLKVTRHYTLSMVTMPRF
ncbi:Sugar/inositol transporter [Sesbania bispinosa]|nr:Sugar/inositol transporter [Sesbania bispinosa]